MLLSKEMSKCIGVFAKGSACRFKSAPDSLYCKKHDPKYKTEVQKKKSESVDLKIKVLTHIAKTVGFTNAKQFEKEDAEAKRIGSRCDFDAMKLYIKQTAPESIHALSLKGIDLRACPEGSYGFSRKIWMLISHHMIDDLVSYFSVAMTCKSIYKIFVKDKLRYFSHPLRDKILSPLMYFFPIFRIVWYEFSSELPELFAFQNLPSIESCLKEYENSLNGYVLSPLERNQKTAKIIAKLIGQLIEKNLEPGEEFEETIKGAGIFDYLPPKMNVEFEGLEYPYTVKRSGRDTFLIVMVNDVDEFRTVERRLMQTIKSFDGKNIIQLMRI